MVLRRYLVDEIAVAAFVGDDGLDGLPTYGEPVVHAARIEEKAKRIEKADGTTVDATTWIATEAVIGDRDRVWTAPMNGNDVRTFPPGFVFVDADARTLSSSTYARRQNGRGGFGEVWI